MTRLEEPNDHAWTGHDGAFHCYGCGDTVNRPERELPKNGCRPLLERLRLLRERPGSFSRQYIAGMLTEMLTYHDGLRSALTTLAAELDMKRAEIEMLRGVGCEEDGDGPCGACLKCAKRQMTVLRVALQDLRQNANRLCDRNLGGTYEDDCRRSITQADRALTQGKSPGIPHETLRHFMTSED